MKSDPKAVEMLKQLNMLQPEAKLDAQRLEEINSVSRMVGLPERTD
jgi:hypothetical protein